MKIILSRKGFDSEYGKKPSPIFENNDMISLPIPEDSDDNISYEELKYKGKNYSDIISSLLNKDTHNFKKCHLDPDLYNRFNNDKWCPIFGQSDSSAGHLINQNIDEGDIFLFFGTFRKVKNIDGKITYDKEFREKHVIFGYMEVCKKIEADSKKYYWHPHAKPLYANNPNRKNNIMFIGKKNFRNTEYPGSGIFKYSEDLVLTKEGMSKSFWKLPDVLANCKFTYHSEKNIFNDYFKSNFKGQEFVTECNEEIIEWVEKMIRENLNDPKNLL